MPDMQQQPQPQQQPPPGLGVPQVQSHTFVTPGGQQLQMHVATTTLPVGMGDGGDFDAGMMYGSGDAAVGVTPQSILSSLMQTIQQQASGDMGNPLQPADSGMALGGYVVLLQDYRDCASDLAPWKLHA